MTETEHAPNYPVLLVQYAEDNGLTPAAMYHTLARTIFPSEKQATPEHVQALLIVAREHGLNPFTKEIYAFPAKSGGIVPIVSVDGWMKLVNQRPECEGIEIDVAMADDGKTPISATCRIYRRGWKVPVEITEYVHEVRRNTEPWRNQPVRMIRHRALIQAARVAFGFGGLYEADEAARFAADMEPEHREVEIVRSDPLSRELSEEPVAGEAAGEAGESGPVVDPQDGGGASSADAEPTLDEFGVELFPDDKVEAYD